MNPGLVDILNSHLSAALICINVHSLEISDRVAGRATQDHAKEFSPIACEPPLPAMSTWCFVASTGCPPEQEQAAFAGKRPHLDPSSCYRRRLGAVTVSAHYVPRKILGDTNRACEKPNCRNVRSELSNRIPMQVGSRSLSSLRRLGPTERMMRVFPLSALGLALVCVSTAYAAGLTGADYQYLRLEFGLRQGDQFFMNMSTGDASELHNLINDPALKTYKQARQNRVADRLFNIHMRECEIWAQSHPGQECPPVADPKAEPGHRIAERECSACHLFGTTEAPSFYQLTKQGGWTAEKLADALQQGHQMSPIGLAPEQVRDLGVYIDSLNR